MYLSLQNRSAIVTGGAQSLGYAVAKRLKEAGAQVAIWDRNEARANESAKELGVSAFVCDVGQLASVQQAFSKTLAAFGKIDILVNNAGIVGPVADTWEYPVESWQQVLDIDLNGPFYCCRTIIPQMLKQKYGRIVNVASIAGKEGNPKLSGYSVAKAGLIALTKSLGKELAQTGVVVNAVAPSVIKSEMNKDVSPEMTAYMLSRIPMSRFAEPEEFAAMVHWLCSDDVSFSTGAVFDLSGGRATY